MNDDFIGPRQLPDDLSRVPGVLGETTDWIEERMFHPNRPLAFAAALSMLSLALCDKLRYRDIRPNAGVLAVGESSTGKTNAIHRAQAILERVGMSSALCGGFASRKAVLEARHSKMPRLWIEEHLDMTITGNGAAAALNAAREGADSSIVIHGQCTPRGFREATKRSDAFQRFASSALVVVAAPRAERRESAITANIPSSIESALRGWRDAEAKDARITPDAYGIHKKQTLVMPGRADLALRLAMIHAASAAPSNPTAIDARSIEWAWAVSTYR